LPADVRTRIAAVRDAVDETALRVGRDPATIRIVAATKTVPPAAVTAALAAGLDDVGENYVQEARAKRATVGRGVWHLIGGLQRYKVRAAVAVFDWIHTVDSAALGAAVAAEAARAGRRLPVLLQVNVGREATKRGLLPEDVEDVARALLGHASLDLAGLMAIPPIPAVPTDSRRYFALLRGVCESARRRLGVELPHLSMGMSDDFLIAVEEGATLLRIGRALFGARGARTRRPQSSGGGEGP